MPEFEVNDVASIGAVRDTPAYMLPPEAWNLAVNMRVIDGGLEALLGWEQVFGTPGVAPHFHMPVVTQSNVFWVYASLTKIYGYDGTTHTDITRTVGGNYTASATQDWNGTLLASVPILNNGTDKPQFWSAISLATAMADLTNWPNLLRAKVIRAFGPFLVAFNLTDNSVSLPHTIQWSHPADPGSIPSSWDYTDATKDAGRRDFPDVNAGVLVDALPLGSVMFVYKESSVWKMRFIGGRFIFDFGESAWLTTTGLLAPRCVCNTGDGRRQVWASQDDIMWHDGNSFDSILSKTQRRRLQNEIDTTNYKTSFIFDNPFYREIWFCYPSSGMSQPNVALVLNYSDPRKWVVTEANGITFRNAVVGPIQSASDEQWNTGSDLWEDNTGNWQDIQRRRVVLAGTDATKFYNMDKTTTRDGTAIATTLQRLGLSVIGKKRGGEPIVDFRVWKMLQRIWPKITGGPVSIRLASQEYVDGPALWSSAVSFDPTLHAGHSVPGPVSGRAVGLEFSTASGAWRLDGYKADIDAGGQF